MEQQQSLTPQQIIDRIKPRILSAEHQADRIKNLVKLSLAGDLVLCWYADVTDLVLPGQGTSAYLPITADLAKSLNLSVEDLLRIGQEHARGTYKVQSMRDAMGALLGLPDDFDSEQDIPMHVICAQSLQYGASSILDTEIQQRLNEICPTGCYLLPSSVHEWIAVPKEKATPSDLAAMVQEINASADVVEPQDVLSNHVFTITEGRLVVAA